MYKDERLPETDTGYVFPWYGDSGSPYWMKCKVKEEENQEEVERQILLAVVKGFLSMPSVGLHPPVYTTNGRAQCRAVASKVSEEVINWIKDIDEMK